MNFTEANKYINSLGHNEINPGLKRVKALCEELGNPQSDFSVIQITGTNGKTSTARMISSILSAHGIKTGVYTSPHLDSITERFEINGKLISEELFAFSLGKIMPKINEANERFYPDRLSYFETVTVLAFIIFQDAGIDCAVLEVGMGGRWDATSVCNPKISVITNVELEHTDRLGDTVSQIAWEKAHIIKEDSVALIGELSNESLKVVKERCLSEKVDLRILGKDFSFLSEDKNNFSVKGLYGCYNDLSLNLKGAYQLKNAVLAISASEIFLKKPLLIEKIKEGFNKVRCPGRLEVLSKTPLVVLDGAHNPAGAKQLASVLRDEFKYNELILILAILKDKDIKGIIDEIAPAASLIVLTENRNERCASCDLLKKYIVGNRYICTKSIPEALNLSLKNAKHSDLICVTGSLSTVAEARNFLKRKLGENFEGKENGLSKYI
ncbi:MAG TPA: bifunctional folylpolyglutamate synthase/dihydrofolate synthase [Actinobacteria bacterium]|nr:bifunctional folylpolyglutamate synthase/dihydrofolate synthase [Actinomycetota bacterium]